MDFDTYLERNGYSRGTYLQPSEAKNLYSSYQSSMSSPAWTMTTNQSTLSSPAWTMATTAKPAEQTQSSGGDGGMGAAAGIAQNYMGGSGGSGGGGGSWAGVPQGALAGWAAGKYKYDNDPKMKSKKDGFGEHYPDYRTQVGGAVGGGVLGYYGLGSIAGPAVSVAQEGMEPATRWAINFGDSWGGSGGALMMDPLGTISSGKYSGEELAYGALLGPAAKWFGLT
jgi:hypothetical protein